MVSIRMHMLAHEAGDCEGIQKSPLVGDAILFLRAVYIYILVQAEMPAANVFDCIFTMPGPISFIFSFL